ncbi:MAG: SMP-30/gluconolactonase/LRE family protein [Planctomycetes bacterium]|nr:SMP-30/gluconolactonase/LRE family protein [Planctomycetota bacterium]
MKPLVLRRLAFVHLISAIGLATAMLAAGCGEGPAPETAEPAGTVGAGLLTPTIAVNLPEKYNTPDGMALAADGTIVLSCPNFNDASHPAVMLRIDKDDQVSEIMVLPVHPETKHVGPLGVAVGPDGHLYIADNQSDWAETPSSRLLRVVMENGKAVRCETLVEGFVQSNAVCVHDGCVYVTETKLKPDATPLVSGVYRFRLADLDPAQPLRVKPAGDDPHLLVTVETKNPDRRVGANGMGFDADGNLYFCNFADAQILKVTFNMEGEVASQAVFAEGQGMTSTDGIKFDPKTGDIYVADFDGNAVHKVDGKTGKVTTLAKNGNTTGAGGELDTPSEVCLRGRRLYVSNIDLPFADNVFDAPHTLSVIELPE